MATRNNSNFVQLQLYNYTFNKYFILNFLRQSGCTVSLKYVIFLGNKDFVIEFLRRGYSVVCVFERPIGKELSGDNKHPPPES